MKRIIWVSLLLAVAGVLLPLVFMSGSGNGEEPAEAPPPEETSSPAPEKYSKDADFRISMLKSGEIVELSMEEYLPFAVAAEMPVTFSHDALCAQAVAARTYVVYCTEHNNPKHPDADICAEYSCCLAYIDEAQRREIWGEKYDENMALIKAACEETDGKILTYNSAVILATFHSSSAGQTEAGAELWADVPYLTSVVSPETADDVPNYTTTVEVTPENFKESVLLLYPEVGFEEDPVLWLGGVERDESGRVRSIGVCNQTLTGSEMRKLFSLRSAAFEVEYNGTAFIFTVTGFGHGLGMSQYGANVMAKNGFDYKEILQHYYPNTKLG